MIFAGNRAISRDHNDALREFGRLARVERVWSNNSGFYMEFTLPLSWCNDISEEDSLHSRVQQYLKNRTISIEIQFVDWAKRDLVRWYILSISTMHGKVSCQTIWEMHKQLRQWEVDDPENERLTWDAVSRVRRDGNFTDDSFARYLWAEEHHKVFRTMMKIGIPAYQAVQMAESRVADLKISCNEPTYYVSEGDESLIFTDSVYA